MPKTYYVWAGVGAIEDLDGDDHVLVSDRTEAVAAFMTIAAEQKRDLTLWERDGDTAKLVAARFGYEVMLVMDETRTTHVLRKPAETKNHF